MDFCVSEKAVSGVLTLERKVSVEPLSTLPDTLPNLL
ncbi:hypothetical protein CFELI_14230 [Corynebacterium felinum]|uniref:Uncharacterized protein n=1 Tax=Corynebacterium felinum TaxID=131318 RepID=A0ABU2B6K2_9CORY|nr:hypothetical protein [Corynebacterium felinum]WJY96417.1 hypothetical protein CFELI_14230 [Corynebacterium felinum]